MMSASVVESKAETSYYLRVASTVKHEGKEAFRLASFSGHEEMSQLFRFRLDLLSERDDIEPQEIIGKPIAFSFQDHKDQPRHFHGYVSRFTAGSGETGMRCYEAEVVPWLWFLTRTSDCRIFADKSVPEILEEVFEDVSVNHPVKIKLKAGEFPKWKYCVQYRETDFDFVSRLMEQEGIFYYFVHEENQHTLVLGDEADHYRKESPGIKYAYSFFGEPKADSVTNWSHGYQFIPGKYAQTDYNFIDHPPGAEPTPAIHLLVGRPTMGKPKTIDPQSHELFDYPAECDNKGQNQRYTERYMQQEEVHFNEVTGSSNHENFSPGSKFSLQEHPCRSENGEYAILRIHHWASDSIHGDHPGATYSNDFICIPSTVPFRPARTTRRPAIQGAQTAVVVGPTGKEINVDEHGRVQVQFFWDRYNTRLQSGGDFKKKAEPIWIRVGQIMAGKNWGAMFVPRIGQEVIVTFLDGDPDRPLITGLVYNAEQTPPYNPKQEATKSYIKTNSSPGGNGYNELRFEDKKGEEQIFIHAERNMDTRARSDSLTFIGGNRHQIIGAGRDGEEDGDQREMVYQDKHLKVHRNRIEHVGGDMQLLVGGIKGDGNQDIVIKKDKKELIEGDGHLHVNGKLNEKVDGDQSLTVGGSQDEKVGTKYALEAGQEIHLKSGMKVVIEAGMQLTLKGPGGFVDIGPAGVTIEGTTVNINSGGAAGAGSGSSPTAPEDAKEAVPIEPSEADNHKTGQKSTPF